MDPISWMMLAQAGISVTGNILNTFGQMSNVDTQKSRAKEQYKMQKEKLDLARGQLDTSRSNAVQDIAASSSSDIASRIQSGQMGPQGQAVSTAATDTATTRMTQGFNQNQSELNLQERQVETDYSNLVSDLDAQKTAIGVNSVLSGVGTALGSYAKLSDRADMLKSRQDELDLISNNYGAEMNAPQDSFKLPESPLIFENNRNKTGSLDFNLFNGAFGSLAPKKPNRPYSIYRDY